MRHTIAVLSSLVRINRVRGFLFGLGCLLAVAPAFASGPVSSGPIEANSALIGDWEGQFVSGKAKSPTIVAQVIAIGDWKYQVNLLPDLGKGSPPYGSVEGVEKGGVITFKSDSWQGRVRGSSFTGSQTVDGKKLAFEMKKAVRLSPALGAKPPKGAVVLFDGTGFGQWQNQDPKKDIGWKILKNGVMETGPKTGSLITKRKFRDMRLHVEFRLPLMPEARGQGRGNSGVYIMTSYELQVLDSYGLARYNNECGGIYKAMAPYVNMCAPPLQWQSYDIEFHGARFDKKGNKTANARISVRHNGVFIHKDREIPHPTGAAGKRPEPKEPDHLLLQDHGNAVQFRNIWLVEL